MSPRCSRKLTLIILSGRLLLVAISLLAFLLAGCSGKTATPPPGASADSTKPAAQVVLTTPQPLITPTAAQSAAEPRATSVSLAPTIEPSPSVTPTTFSSPTPLLASPPVTPEPIRLTRLAWSPDGALLAVGSATGVYLYDTATWREVRFIPLQVSVPSSLGDGPKELAFSYDGTLLATLGRVVQVWRVADGSFAYEVKASALLAASPAEGLWATFGEDGSASGNLRLWRTSDGQLVRSIATGLDFPSSMAFSSEGRLIAAGPMSDGSPGIWRAADGRQLSRLNWAQADIFSWIALAFRPNSATVAAVGGLPEAVLLLWDANSGAVTRQLVALNELPQGPTLNGVSYAPNSSLLAASFWGNASQQSMVQLWGADGARGRSWPLAGQPNDVAFSPDGALLAILTGQGVYLYNPSDGSVLRQVEPTWQLGVLPTPTPTPLSAGLNLPADWPECYVTRYPVKVRYPATWYIGRGSDSFNVVDNPEGHYTPTTMWLDVTVGNCSHRPRPGDPSIVEDLKSSAAWKVGEQLKFVAGGKWPILVPATYVELEGTRQGRRIRSILLESAPQGEYCFWVTLFDEPEDITDQVRLNISRVLASIEFPDPQHPFPTMTPTASQ